MIVQEAQQPEKDVA